MVIRNLRRFTEAAARARISAVLAAHRRLRASRSALHSGSVPRHRQGARRRPFACWARATRGASAATTRCRRRRRTGRVAGGPPPGDVVDGAEAGPHRPGRDCRLRRPGRRPSAADRALPAHGCRYPRHEPQGVEQLEGQAARGSLSRGAQRYSRALPPRTHDPGQRRSETRRGAAPAAPLRGARRRGSEAVEASRHAVFPAPQRRGNRLARASPLLAG